MEAIFLAAGYATRLYPLTKNKAKPLLEVGGKTIMDYLLGKIRALAHDIFVVTNHRFAHQFEEWGKERDVKIIDDGTMSNEDRLGAVGDIHYVIKKCGLSDDLFVIAGDNIFDEDFNDFGMFFKEKNGPCVMVEEKNDVNALKRCGVAVIENDIIIDFEEKPDKPKSSFAVPPVYIYPKGYLDLFDRYMSEGRNPDAPGHFVEWLVKQTRVYAYPMRKLRYDIGTLESYQEVKKVFGEKVD